MSRKEELLSQSYESACAAMYALEEFLQEVDNSLEDETRANYQNLKVIGNRIFE